MTEQLKELRVSNDAMNDPEELRRRIAEEGYLFFKRLQNPDKLQALRREICIVPVVPHPAGIQVVLDQLLSYLSIVRSSGGTRTRRTRSR